jgi:hypothetical protein
VIRWIAVASLAVIAAALILWQQSRERSISACLSTGGSWNGSSCAPGTDRTILRRDLHRT